MLTRFRHLALIAVFLLAALPGGALRAASEQAAFSPQAIELAAQQDAEAVTQYLRSGGQIPAWAKDPSFRAALSQEAQAQGLPAPAALPLAKDMTWEGQTLLAALRLARMLANGAVAPVSVQGDWTIPPPDLPADAALKRLVAFADPLPWLRSLAPQGNEYQELKKALAAYHAIAVNGGWPTLPEGATLKPGMSGERVAVLQARLEAEGDLAAGAASSTVFDAATAQAVRRFEARHGLAIDGRVGREMRQALNVDALQRYREIAANLERWRWLAHALPPDRIMVNAAAAELVLFERGEPVLRLRTIMGKPRSPTPVLTARVGSLLLNPPWEIPTQIAAREIRPLARRDPGYLDREGIVTVAGGTRLRQLPGPQNALGQIKFEMPNPLDVYLHDTPSKALFARDRRFFSHGCIRLETPEKLALRLLQHDPAWTPEALAQAVATGETRRVPFTPSIAIFVVYFTALIGPGGAVEFRDDVYRRDPPLIAALFPEMQSPAEPRRVDSATECRAG